MLSVEPRIDHRITSGRKGSDSLGIFANTVDRPSAPKPKKKTAKADADEAVMQNRKARYQLQRAAQGLLPQERVAHCQRSTMSAAGVAVYRSDNGSSFGNLTTCGSVWHCPVCAAKITEGRRQELQGAINAWAANGGTVYLMSLTFPHQVNQSLKNNLDLFSGALKKFKQSKLYRNVMAAVGSAGSIRSMEVTHGVHGWHPHTHDLVFAKPEQLEALQALQMEWIETLIKVGIADRSQINDMLMFAFDVKNGDYAAEYVAKFGHEATEASKAITENHWGASNEMTKSYAKVGKRLSGRTPFTLLADYIKGNKASGELFTEFGLCFKGKRQLFWSPKLTAALKLLGYDRHEKTDEEIAAEPMAERELVKVMTHEDWKLVLSRNARFQVLDAADKGGKEAVEKLLEELAGRKQTHQGVYSYQEYGGHKYNRPYLVEMH